MNKNRTWCLPPVIPRHLHISQTRSFAATLVEHGTLHNPQPPQHHHPFQIDGSKLESQKNHHNQRENRSIPFSQAQSPRQLLISLIKSTTQKTHLLPIHAHILRTSLIQDHSVSLQFLSRAALSPVRDLGYSRLFFFQIPEPNVLQYNTMIRAYSMSDSPEEGVYMYREMRRRGLCPDPVSSSFALRSCIREKAIQTTPGCSTIELKGIVHEFVSDDVSHQRKDEIYKMLDEINSQLKIAGYEYIEDRNMFCDEYIISCRGEESSFKFRKRAVG
ncbi:hypothetical protein FEM48_Zijuj05G0145600 [Ziziphus jujuba var. spinosa]|uniref:Pentatricopeptide repeat-containing protein n=1 Tax=Ziziphus jujuba var. spinosa TaxID=714518 RepID=A0A978VFD5_ZIZJJ|nr:hypothetical protein FEM48_Zijuj05G0145600 [Ziziphus jujuba var. spinosa]